MKEHLGWMAEDAPEGVMDKIFGAMG